ncbi:MAG: two-component system LytT family sensor kinase [Saprospiraceae bacterium]|jgi:two-component system LytT family sensor kinase
MRDPKIQLFEVLAFFNYAVGAFVISYLLLPRFYTSKKLIELILLSSIVVLCIILVEELVLEKIFFPDNRGQKMNIIFTVLQVFPKIMMLVGFKLGWDSLTIRNEMEKLKNLATQNELQFLQSQINPHFLFNNLNNLYSYALEKSDKTPEIILQLSGLLRYMLYECKEEYVSLRKDVDQLSNFIALNELQIEDRGTVTFTTSDNLDRYKIAPLLLIVFVENAFKHSVSSLSDEIKINVDVQVDDDGKLHFLCENCFSESTNIDNIANGIGLVNVEKRLDLIYKDRYNLKAISEHGVYRVLLNIEL